MPECILRGVQLLPMLLLGLCQNTISLLPSLCGTLPAARASEVAGPLMTFPGSCLLCHLSPLKYGLFQKALSFSFAVFVCLLGLLTFSPDLNKAVGPQWDSLGLCSVGSITLHSHCPMGPWAAVFTMCLLARLVYIFQLISSFLPSYHLNKFY